MNATLIIDCSITMAWCFSDEATAKTDGILQRLVDETALVPALWFLEVVNVLAMAEKRGRIKPAKSGEFLSLLETFDIEVADDSAGRAFSHILPLCRHHGLTSYDAAYLELAARRNLPLASLDDDLRLGAMSLGVQLLGK
ncbi:MAG: type II toxin-antitoxin system VapC family toxin [Pirellulales bacterium]